MKTNIYMVGMGGIGSQLCEPICRFINYLDNKNDFTITFIDGDEYESSNQSRQTIELSDVGENKAICQYTKIYNLFPYLEINANAIYINKQNIKDCFDKPDENTIILSGVDNDKTRNVIQEYCGSLKNVLLLSGGNEYIDGDVQIYARRKGVDLTPPIWKWNSNIKNPKDRSPEEIGCDELVESTPQLIFTNGMVSACMCMAFYNYYKMFETDIIVDKSVIMFDISEISVVSRLRKM